ncbi:hypothetical protein [Actinomyces dentalis]|uniref:hypothetical protein n=3 Tax=Actinomyces dentalis TaxID=272548 RepID=UPI0004060D14|nr:hypothetical protein [Actinomyces dentalis]
MTAPHEASPHPPSETPRPPQPTASFAPGPGFVVALVVIVLIVVLALAAAVSSALGVMGVSRLLGGAALVLVGAGLVVALRVPARSVVVNAPRLRLERSRARAGRRAERARAESARGGEGGPGPAGRSGAEPGALMTRPTAGALAVPASSRRELTTLDVVSGPVTTALAASGVGRAADERLAGTTTGEALLRVAQLLAGALGFVLMALGLASILGQVLR